MPFEKTADWRGETECRLLGGDIRKAAIRTVDVHNSYAPISVIQRFAVKFQKSPFNRGRTGVGVKAV